MAGALLRLADAATANMPRPAHGLQAAAAREAAAMRKVVGDHPGALDLVDRAERLARAACILAADGADLADGAERLDRAALGATE